jgi:hypothetical protein
MNYTHNLKILLLDNEDNIVDDDIFLNEIKNKLCENNSIMLDWNGKPKNITIKWEQKELSEVCKLFMGDLFAYPIYEFDSIIFNHTNDIITQIYINNNSSSNSKYKIKFYISRIICDKKNNKNSCGVIF